VTGGAAASSAGGVTTSQVETIYPDLAYFNEVDKGGHFAAWEEPDLFATEMRAAFRPLQSPKDDVDRASMVVIRGELALSPHRGRRRRPATRH
jgi:hypothetical protein